MPEEPPQVTVVLAKEGLNQLRRTKTPSSVSKDLAKRTVRLILNA